MCNRPQNVLNCPTRKPSHGEIILKINCRTSNATNWPLWVEKLLAKRPLAPIPSATRPGGREKFNAQKRKKLTTCESYILHTTCCCWHLRNITFYRPTVASERLKRKKKSDNHQEGTQGAFHGETNKTFWHPGEGRSSARNFLLLVAVH